MEVMIIFFFFFNDTATTEIYTLSLHDALPICQSNQAYQQIVICRGHESLFLHYRLARVCRTSDRKSTRLNSSHSQISYAVFCLKKKNKINNSVDSQPSPTISTPLRIVSSL